MYAIEHETVWPGLGKLLEELGELSVVLAKIIGTGGETNYWDGVNLLENLEDELGDVLASFTWFVEKNPTINGSKIHDRAQMKIDLFDKWHKEGSDPR